MQIERPALTACMSRSFPFIYRRLNAVDLPDVGEGETAGAGTDDGDAER